MPAGHEYDPLLAVLEGDPVAPDADDATRAAHQAAEADVALLRGALRDIGDALAAAPVPPAAAAPAAPDVFAARRRARRRAAATWGAGLAAAAAFTGVVYLGATGAVRGDANYSASDAKQDAGGNEKAAGPGLSGGEPAVACASLVVEGTVVDLRPLTDGHVQVTLDAERYWVPEQEASEVPVAVTVLPEEARADLPVGTRALVVQSSSGDRWATGDRLAAERAELDAARSGADEGVCPRE